jgi:hypothetical protein
MTDMRHDRARHGLDVNSSPAIRISRDDDLHVIVITSTMIESAGASRGDNPSPPRAWGKTQQRETKMKAFLKLGVPAATFVVAAALGALTPRSASAGDYCRTDVTGHMTSCSYTSLEQCQAMSSGIGGDCFRDPKLANSSAPNGDNAFAYQPSAPRTTKHTRGNATESRQ